MTKAGLKLLTGTALMVSALALSGCGIEERLSSIGRAPDMARIENPYKQPGYKPVALPMPPQEAQNSQANSLWQASRQTFFKDQRAHKIGDILTIMIDINDTADLKNKTERTREGEEKQGLPNLLGIAESQLGKVLPEAVDPASLVDMDSSSTSTGNFVIQGRQQVRVNHELRDLQLQGVIRPEDILNNNSISYEKIAEARISYGGQGSLTDIQQPRYGQQFFDAVFPF
jgi:flagellar L-ring protein precursor FlgH